jgi:D-amino-acid dehydrogenase
MMTLDAIVVGGGIVGASMGYHLAKMGLNTRLIDRHDIGRATDAGAGILSPETSSSESEDWYRFGVTAVNYYQPMIQNLNEVQDGDTGYAMCGLLRVAVSDDEIDPYNDAHRVVFERQLRNNTPPISDLYEVTSKEAKEIFPALAPVHKAFYHRTGARVDGRLLCAALTKAGIHYGLDVQKASVDKLLIEDNQVIGIIVDGEEIRAGKVAIAGGAWSMIFAQQLGVHIPVEPQRGQIIHLQLDGVDTTNWAVINAFRGHYMVAWENGRVVVGATRETGSGFEPQTSASGVHEVLSEALRVAPGLASAQLLEVRVGLRPYSADRLPVLGTVPNTKNVYLATGHGPTGLQLGPYSGKVVADMMAENMLSDDLSAFHITRFMS